MKKNNILLIVNDTLNIEKLNQESNITFLFPMEKYSVGFNKTFKLEEIKEEGFIFVNRIMDNKSIEEFKEVLKQLPPNIKGIVFDDIGILNILITLKLDIIKILYLNHFNSYVDSVVVSPDITNEEITEILEKSIKPLVLYTFGHVNIMYSRRNLISNYNVHYNKDVPLLATLKEKNSLQKFKIMENNYGTVIYTNEPFNNLVLRSKRNVLYNLINTVFLTEEEILNIIHSKDNMEDIYPYKYLSERKTIYKLKERE